MAEKTESNVSTRRQPENDEQVWPEVHTHEQADAQAAERDIEWPETPNEGPEGRLTVQQKQAILNGNDFDWSQKSGMR